MAVALPAFPDCTTPIAADDEQTDSNNGMAVPLQVDVRPPERGITTFWATLVCALIPAAP